MSLDLLRSIKFTLILKAITQGCHTQNWLWLSQPSIFLSRALEYNSLSYYSIRIHSQSFIEVLRSQPTRFFTIFTFPSSSLAYSQSLCICGQLWISQSLINWLLVLTILWSELKAIATTLPLNLLSDYCLILDKDSIASMHINAVLCVRCHLPKLAGF